MSAKSTTTNSARTLLTDAFYVLAGAVIFGIAINIFLIPNDLMIGGSSGIATMISHFTGVGVGLLNLLLNIPLLILSIRENGFRSMIKTMIGTVAVSVATDVFVFLPDMTGDFLLCAVAGGGGMGLGSGFMMLRGFTSGGADLAAFMIHRRAPRLSTGRIVVVMDVVIIGTSAIILKSYTLLAYCVICSAAYGFAIDFIMSGANVCRSAMIISDKYEEIADRIISDLTRGVTILDGQGWYTKENRKVLLCVVRRREEFELRRLIASIDPQAFIILNSSCEAIGFGFRGHDSK